MGLFIYLRNLYLIQLNKKEEAGEIEPRTRDELLSTKIVRNAEAFSCAFGLIMLLMMGYLFYHNAQWDVVVAGKFYESSKGFWVQVPLIDFLRKAVPVLSIGSLMVIGLGWLYRLIKKESKLGFSHHAAAFLLISLIMGPGVLVNGVCKNGFHRARPHQTAEFGGEKTFTPAFVITNQCKKNCSFVSGDTSIMYFLFAFSLLFPGWRLAGFAVSLSLGLLVGYGRMAYGAHFLSDVIFSGFLVYLTTLLVYLLLGKPTAWNKKKKA